MTANTDVLESGATVEETPYFTLPAGPRGSVVMYQCGKDPARIDIDAVLPAATRQAVMRALSPAEGEYQLISNEHGGNTSFVGWVSVAIARAIINLFGPAPKAA
jgi:hypothetical protein